MPNLVLDWAKSDSGEWYSFTDVDLADDQFKELSGVYVIFYMDDNRYVTVRLGKGDIADRITDHRTDGEITAHGDGQLLVTWAVVPANQQERVERFLALALHPIVGERFPDRVPLKVNLPY